MRNKIFIRTLLLSLVVLAVCIAGFSKEKAVESIWVGSSLSIDGLDDDWAGDALNFEKKCKVDYAFRNDADNLYVLFIFKDPVYQSTIKATGMTLWLNPEGKKKKKYGINFNSKRVKADTIISILEKRQGPLPEAEKNEIRSRAYYMFYQGEVIDKKGNILTASALAGESEVPSFRLKENNKMMVLEFVMSLRVLEKLSTNQRMEPGKTVKIGFEWGGLTETMKAQRMARIEQSASSESERSARGSSGSRGGGGSLGGARLRKGPKQYSFWVDVELAQKD